MDKEPITVKGLENLKTIKAIPQKISSKDVPELFFKVIPFFYVFKFVLLIT